jgi:hypothetical protein
MRGWFLNMISRMDKMLRIILRFNPDYPKIRVILFKHRLKILNPSLSGGYAVALSTLQKHLQKNIYKNIYRCESRHRVISYPQFPIHAHPQNARQLLPLLP